jgi:hypothetical protein
MRIEFCFKLRQPRGQLAMSRQNFAQTNEGADDEYATLDGPRRVQDACGHDRTVLSEGEGERAAAAMT